MTQEELVDLGKVLAALSRMQGELTGLRATVGTLQNTVATQTSQIAALNSTNQHLADKVMKLTAVVERLPCNDQEHDTNPTCLSDAAKSARPFLRSVSEDEPDSVVTRQMELNLRNASVRGPGIMVIALGAVVSIAGVASLIAWGWIRRKLGLS